MSFWVVFGLGLLMVIYPEPSKSDLVQLDPFALSALRNIITKNLDNWVEANFNEANVSLAEESYLYGQCQQKIKAKIDECGQCVADRCLESFNKRCVQQPEQPEQPEQPNIPGDPTIPEEIQQPEIQQVELPPQVDTGELICNISPESCAAIKIGETAVKVLKGAVGKVKDAIKKGFKKVGSIAKKIFSSIAKPVKKIIGAIGKFRIRLPRIRLPRIRLPRIRLPRIRLPRIRLPRIRLPRIRLPRIRLPRIRLPRIRLPRIRLPRIRLPRIRLPRIRLPRIRLPRIRLPRIIPRIRLPRIRLPRIRFRFRSWGKRRRRQTTEPTCDDIIQDSAGSCLFYQELCDSCSVYGSPGTPQPREQLITTVCGAEFVETANRVEILENRLGRLETVYEIQDTAVFNVTSVQYDPGHAQEEGHLGVLVSFVVLGEKYNVTISDPVPIFSHPTAGPIIAKWIFENIFEDL